MKTQNLKIFDLVHFINSLLTRINGFFLDSHTGKQTSMWQKKSDKNSYMET